MFKIRFLLYLTILICIFNRSLHAIDRNRINIGVSTDTPASSYIPGSGDIPGGTPVNDQQSQTSHSNGPSFFQRTKQARIINKEAYKKCSEDCLLNGDECLNDCLCAECWRETIGSQSELIDFCKCRNPVTTQFLHF